MGSQPSACGGYQLPGSISSSRLAPPPPAGSISEEPLQSSASRQRHWAELRSEPEGAGACREGWGCSRHRLSDTWATAEPANGLGWMLQQSAQLAQQRGQLGAARSLFLAIAALGPASASLQERQQALEWAEMLATVSGDLEEAGQMRRRIKGLFEPPPLAGAALHGGDVAAASRPRSRRISVLLTLARSPADRSADRERGGQHRVWWLHRCAGVHHRHWRATPPPPVVRESAASPVGHR